MYGLVRVAGFGALVLTPAALLAATVGRPPTAPVGVLGLETVVVLAGSVAAVAERERAFGRVDAPELHRGKAVDALAVVAGAVLAYALSVHGGLGPVLGSALVGLAAGVATPRVAVPAYCGSFVGMASPDLFPSVAHVAVAGAVAGGAFVATAETFGGFGGKLGTIALFGCATTLALLPGVGYATGSPLAWTAVGVVVPVAVLGAVATVVLSVRLGLGAVVGSALVGVVAGVAFPTLIPGAGAPLAIVAFCASFVGMSTTERLGHEGHVAVAGALSGVVFLAVAPAFAGAGGKLGTVAFLSCIGWFGAVELVDSLAPFSAR